MQLNLDPTIVNSSPVIQSKLDELLSAYNEVKSQNYNKSYIELYCKQFETLNRQKGRTTLLIDSLPENGDCYIYTNKKQNFDYLIDRIKRDRPVVKVENIKYYNPSHSLGLSLEEKQKVFVDNNILDSLISNFLRNRAF